MSTNTKIEWTQATWNPVTGCTRVSAGCDRCYAVKQTHRLQMMGQVKYGGLTVLNGKGDRHFNGTVKCHDDALSIPLKRKKPTTYFVNSMSDLFHAGVPWNFVEKIFAVARLCPQHTFQILTKRPERAAQFMPYEHTPHRVAAAAFELCRRFGIDAMAALVECGDGGPIQWPLPNVWLGTSCENQEAADLRIPHLLKCPAAVRFLSVEPMLGPVDLSEYIYIDTDVTPGPDGMGVEKYIGPQIHWCILGGESGPGSRTCDVDWFRAIVKQCREAGVACFVKQLGHSPVFNGGDQIWMVNAGLVDSGRRDPKGGNMNEWPADLRVREMPKAVTA